MRNTRRLLATVLVLVALLAACSSPTVTTDGESDVNSSSQATLGQDEDGESVGSGANDDNTSESEAHGWILPYDTLITDLGPLWDNQVLREDPYVGELSAPVEVERLPGEPCFDIFQLIDGAGRHVHSASRDSTQVAQIAHNYDPDDVALLEDRLATFVADCPEVHFFVPFQISAIEPTLATGTYLHQNEWRRDGELEDHALVSIATRQNVVSVLIFRDDAVFDGSTTTDLAASAVDTAEFERLVALQVKALESAPLRLTR